MTYDEWKTTEPTEPEPRDPQPCRNCGEMDCGWCSACYEPDCSPGPFCRCDR
jgi:hypothetical protein